LKKPRARRLGPDAEAAASLAPGNYTLTVTVTNTNGGSKASLERAFEVGA